MADDGARRGPSAGRPDPGSRAGSASGGDAAGTPGTEPPPTGVDLARVALRAARQRARERGAVQPRRARTPGLRSGARPGGRDPLPLGAAFERLKSERGWEMPIAVGGVSGRWPEVVGPDVALHCVPEGYDERERVLTVRCDSTAWATQLRLLAPQLLARLNAELGPSAVKLIKVRGPGGPPKKPGQWRAPGSRGPGDTYG
ncbi:DUF721 domain-containing protein [Streptomyces sp. SM14]|uniref:DUF721 domain-containing protein n=2 Tax=unclassified Streptomyces TaxID=2593676 RepID=UPI000CD4C1EE